MSKTTGQIIKEARKDAKVTQKELADRLGIAESTLSKWENGMNSPKPDDLIRISDQLGIPLKELINDKSSEDSEETASPQPLAAAETTSQSNDFVLRIADKDLVIIVLMVAIALYIGPFGIFLMPIVFYIEFRKKMPWYLIAATVALTLWLIYEFSFYMGVVPFDTRVWYEDVN